MAMGMVWWRRGRGGKPGGKQRRVWAGLYRQGTDTCTGAYGDHEKNTWGGATCNTSTSPCRCQPKTST
eukprot:1157330-Pelagomonas_calceolata.AAC.6